MVCQYGNDMFGDKGDRWRTGGLAASWNKYEVGFNVWTNDPTEKRASTEHDSMWGEHTPKHGKTGKGKDKVSIAGIDQKTWKDGYRLSSPLWVGIRTGGGQHRFGVDAAWVQDAFQNGIHRYISKTTAYFQPGAAAPRSWSYTGPYFPFTLY
jgi:hypothetical protein